MKQNTKLFRRDFALVVIGQIISLFGNAILRSCQWSAVLADRINKRNIMVVLIFAQQY